MAQAFAGSIRQVATFWISIVRLSNSASNWMADSTHKRQDEIVSGMNGSSSTASRVLRFWNSDVTENLAGVLEVIAAKVSELKARKVTPTRRWRADLPLSGGGAPSSWKR
jgi:hypothetical protein